MKAALPCHLPLVNLEKIKMKAKKIGEDEVVDSWGNL